MYTDEMKRAFHSIHAPKGFSVDLIDNEFFMTIRMDEKKFYYLSYDEKLKALEYVMRLKKALEDNGAVVEVVRKAMSR